MHCSRVQFLPLEDGCSSGGPESTSSCPRRSRHDLRLRSGPWPSLPPPGSAIDGRTTRHAGFIQHRRRGSKSGCQQPAKDPDWLGPAISPGETLRLARLLEMSPQFWMRLQADWDLHQAINGRHPHVRPTQCASSIRVVRHRSVGASRRKRRFQVIAPSPTCAQPSPRGQASGRAAVP